MDAPEQKKALESATDEAVAAIAECKKRLWLRFNDVEYRLFAGKIGYEEAREECREILREFARGTAKGLVGGITKALVQRAVSDAVRRN